MDVKNKLVMGFHLLGIRENGHFGLRVTSYMVIQWIMVANITWFLFAKWNFMDDRINAVKALLFLLTSISYSVSYACYWNEFSEMLSAIYEKEIKVPFKVTLERQNLIDSMEKDMHRFDVWWSNLVITYVTTSTICPLLYVIIRLTIFSENFQNVIQDNLSVQFPLYYPKSINTYPNTQNHLNSAFYIFGYTTHTIYIFFISIYAYIANVSTLCAMSKLDHELKLLRLSLMEMEEYIKNMNRNQSDQTGTTRLFLQYFIQNHQSVYRTFGLVSKGIRWVTATMSFVSSLYMCMSIYTIIQKEEIVSKIKEGIFFSVWALTIYLFDVSGEKVKTEGEKLRNALYECSWIDKPKWFKSSILVAMTHSCKPLDFTPLGLFRLNLTSYATTMQAAYSYYNLLHNFKSQ